MPARRVSTLMIVSLTALACSADGSTSNVATWCAGGTEAVPVAFTPADDRGRWTREGRNAPRFVELWRAGGTQEGEELAYPLSIAESATGRLAIADFQLGELVVVNADGAWLGTWARRGQGPGELSDPVGANWTSDGSAVVVFDISSHKVMFVRDDEPVRPDMRLPREMTSPVLASGSLEWAGVTPSGSALLEPSPSLPRAATSETETQRVHSVLLRSRPGSESFDTIATAAIPTMGGGPPYGAFAAPGFSRLEAAVGADGRIAVGGESAAYRIRLLGPDGTTAGVVCREAKPLPLEEREVRTPEGGARAPEMEAAVAAAPRPDSLAPFGRLFISHEGRLWVQRDRPSVLRSRESYHGVPGALYDVFDADGVYLGEIRAPENARLQAALGDTVWAYEIGELDETWVVAYALRWEEESE